MSTLGIVLLVIGGICLGFYLGLLYVVNALTKMSGG